MSRDELLVQLYAARRHLTIMIGHSATEVVKHEDLLQLMRQRDRIVWMINRCTVATLTTALADTDKAGQQIIDATDELEKLKSTGADIAKGVEIANTIVTVAAAIVTAVL